MDGDSDPQPEGDDPLPEAPSPELFPPEPEPEPEMEPLSPPASPPFQDAFRPRSMGGDGLGVRDIGMDYLEQAGYGAPPQPVYSGPPKPTGDPILYKDLNRTRAIMRGQRKVTNLEAQRRALEVQQQALTVDYSTSLIEVEEELREVRTTRLDEVGELAKRVDTLQDEIEVRKAGDAAVAAERAERTLEAARLKKDLAKAEEKQGAIERVGQVAVRELEFERDGLASQRSDLESQLNVARQSESEARHRAERAEAEAAALREESKKDKWELRKTKDMCKNLQAHSQTADEIRREKQLVQNSLDNTQAAASKAASEALARERDLLEKLHTAREDVKRDREVAEVRQEEIVRQREQLREKEHVITELARVNATLEVQEARLETLLEERERILMNSAVAEVNRLKEALKEITASRDKLRQELQSSVDKMEMFQKKMAAQEDLVRKAAYTNVSYGKRLEDLTMGLKQKHSDVTAAKRLQIAAEETADDLRIQLGKTEKEFEMHRADSVDAQVHKVTVREKEQAEKRMALLRDEIRTLRREMSFNSGQYEGVIERLDSELASVKEKLDTKIAEEAEALKHGGTAMQKLKMQVEALELKKRELHAIAKSAEKKRKAAEQKANDMEMAQSALETDAKRAKHACAHAQEERGARRNRRKGGQGSTLRRGARGGSPGRADTRGARVCQGGAAEGGAAKDDGRAAARPAAPAAQPTVRAAHGGGAPGLRVVPRHQPRRRPRPALDCRGGVLRAAAGPLRHAPRRPRRSLLFQHGNERVVVLPPDGQPLPQDCPAVWEPDAGGGGAAHTDAPTTGQRRIGTFLFACLLLSMSCLATRRELSCSHRYVPTHLPDPQFIYTTDHTTGMNCIRDTGGDWSYVWRDTAGWSDERELDHGQERPAARPEAKATGTDRWGLRGGGTRLIVHQSRRAFRCATAAIVRSMAIGIALH